VSFVDTTELEKQVKEKSALVSLGMFAKSSITFNSSQMYVKMMF